MSNGRLGRLRADDALQAKIRYKLHAIEELRSSFDVVQDRIYHCGQLVNLQAGNGELVLIQCKICQLTFINVLSPTVNGGIVFRDAVVYESERIWARTNPELLKEGVS